MTVFGYTLVRAQDLKRAEHEHSRLTLLYQYACYLLGSEPSYFAAMSWRQNTVANAVAKQIDDDLMVAISGDGINVNNDNVEEIIGGAIRELDEHDRKQRV